MDADYRPHDSSEIYGHTRSSVTEDVRSEDILILPPKLALSRLDEPMA